MTKAEEEVRGLCDEGRGDLGFTNRVRGFVSYENLELFFGHVNGPLVVTICTEYHIPAVFTWFAVENAGQCSGPTDNAGRMYMETLSVLQAFTKP